MDIPENLTRPENLKENKRYWLKLSGDMASMPTFTQVVLVGMTACPGVVIVQDDRGRRLRCKREALFSYNSIS